MEEQEASRAENSTELSKHDTSRLVTSPGDVHHRLRDSAQLKTHSLSYVPLPSLFPPPIDHLSSQFLFKLYVRQRGAELGPPAVEQLVNFFYLPTPFY